MTNDLTDILGELYAIDPGLKEFERELIPLIKTLQSSDPVRPPDERFVAELRSRLQQRAVALTEARASSDSISIFPFMNKLLFAIGGAVAAVVIAVPATYYAIRQPGMQSVTQSDGAKTDLFAYQVTPEGEKAFGNLSTVAAATRNQSGGGGGGLGGTPMIDQSGNAEASMVMGTDPAAAPMPADAKMIAPGMIAPEYTRYEYVYDGDLSASVQEKVDVLKRQKNARSLPFSSIAGSFDIGAVDMSSFDGTSVESINLVQDRQYGYTINLQFNEGMFSVNQNWERWPHPEQDCRDEACYKKFRLTIDQIPSDDALIAVADAFMQEHGIDLSGYGKPEVDNLWKREYERAADKSQAWVPDTQRVIYPQLVEGRPVYDEGGAKLGISVGVHVREKKVSDVWGIAGRQYLKSAYDGGTAEDVKNFLVRMSAMPGYMPPETKSKTVKVQLGEPVVGYAKFYRYENNTNDELIVPSLVFPITNAEGEMIWRQTLVVPLARELLNRDASMIDPRPMM